MATTGVAQRNVELASKGYAAFNDQDVETVTKTETRRVGDGTSLG